MQIKYWTGFNKRDKSTKQPTGGTTVDVKLKLPCSIEAPVFQCETIPADANYMQAFGRYYFVREVTYITNTIIEFTCIEDELATYKTDVGNYNAFIERSASSYNIMLPDPYVAIENESTSQQTGTPSSTQKVPSIFDSEGSYIVSVLNKKGSGAGFTTYYAIGVGALKKLAGYCNHNPGDVQGISNWLEWIQATWCKTADAIIDCKWLPISWETMQSAPNTASEVILVGKDEVNYDGEDIYAYRFTNISVKGSTGVQITLPHKYSDFRKGAPYTRGILNLPYYGFWEFNPLDFEEDIVNVNYVVDLTSGDTLIVISGSSKTVATLHINIALTVPVGKVGNQVMSGVTQTLGSIASAAASFTTGGAAGIAAGVAASASAINGIATAATGISPSVNGNTQGRAMTVLNREVYAVLTFSDTTVPADLAHDQGRPLMARRQIGTLSGFVKCSDASLDIAGTSAERTALNAALNSGFFYE